MIYESDVPILYDSYDSTILLQEFYESEVPILRFYLKSFMKVMCRFYDSSDSTIFCSGWKNGVYSWFLCTIMLSLSWQS